MLKSIEQTKRISLAVILIPIIFFLGIYTPVFIWLWRNWLHNPSYQHGFLIPIIFSVIFWLRRQYLILNKPTLSGMLIIFAGLLTYALSFFFGEEYIGALSLLTVIAGLLIFHISLSNARKFLSAIAFLILMIPFPFIDPVSMYLQTATVYASSTMAGWSGVHSIIVGNQIQAESGNFIIGTTCSGINNLLALLTIAAIICFLTRGSILRKCIVIISVIPVAIVTNSIRVALILIIARYLGTGPALDYFHFYSDLVLFVMAISLLLLEVRALRCNFRSFQELRNG
jgi:exosortase